VTQAVVGDGSEYNSLTDIWTTLGWTATTGGSSLFCIYGIINYKVHRYILHESMIEHIDLTNWHLKKVFKSPLDDRNHTPCSHANSS
jgi:hypothetical protein